MTDNHFDREAARRQNRKITRSSTLISLLGVGLFLLSGVLIYKLTPGPLEKLQEESKHQIETNLSFEMVQKDQSGQWIKLDHTPTSGEQLSFRISTNQPLYVSLISEPNQSHPRTLFDDIRIPPGENKIINFNNQDYQYTVKESDKQIRFCLITAPDTATLTKRLMVMQEKGSSSQFPDEHCVNW